MNLFVPPGYETRQPTEQEQRQYVAQNLIRQVHDLAQQIFGVLFPLTIAQQKQGDEWKGKLDAKATAVETMVKAVDAAKACLLHLSKDRQSLIDFAEQLAGELVKKGAQP